MSTTNQDQQLTRRSCIVYVPLELAVEPVEGHAYVNEFWIVHSIKGLAFYVAPQSARRYITQQGERYEPSPQCNIDIKCVLKIRDRLYPDHGVRFMSVVYAEHAVTVMKEHIESM